MQIGQSIPALSAQALDRGEIRTVDLAGERGQWLVLLFYPGDFTFVCPTELRDAARLQDDFARLGARLMSVSTDSVWVHKAWMDQSPALRQVRFPMLADPTGAIARAFGVYREEGVCERATFLVDPDGAVRVIELHDDGIGRNLDEMVRRLEAARVVREQAGEVCPAGWRPGDATLRRSLALVGGI